MRRSPTKVPRLSASRSSAIRASRSSRRKLSEGSALTAPRGEDFRWNGLRCRGQRSTRAPSVGTTTADAGSGPVGEDRSGRRTPGHPSCVSARYSLHAIRKSSNGGRAENGVDLALIVRVRNRRKHTSADGVRSGEYWPGAARSPGAEHDRCGGHLCCSWIDVNAPKTGHDHRCGMLWVNPAVEPCSLENLVRTKEEVTRSARWIEDLHRLQGDDDG